jgi:hypothetical protein
MVLTNAHATQLLAGNLADSAPDTAPDQLAHTLDQEFAESRFMGLTQQQLIDRIIDMNPTASSAFLSCFTVEQLWAYLEHLDSASRPRGRHSRRICPEGMTAVCWSERQS